jgi:hypothetical protein
MNLATIDTGTPSPAETQRCNVWTMAPEGLDLGIWLGGPTDTVGRFPAFVN